MSLLQRARFGQTELGSFVLTIECDVPPRLQPPLFADDGDPDAPLERRTSIRLAQALEGTEAASRESAASGHIDPFRSRARVGVNANLCEAMAEMIECTAAEAIRASFSFALRRPLATRVPRSVVFTSDLSPLLREAAARGGHVSGHRARRHGRQARQRRAHARRRGRRARARGRQTPSHPRGSRSGAVPHGHPRTPCRRAGTRRRRPRARGRLLGAPQPAGLHRDVGMSPRSTQPHGPQQGTPRGRPAYHG